MLLLKAAVSYTLPTMGKLRHCLSANLNGHPHMIRLLKTSFFLITITLFLSPVFAAERVPDVANGKMLQEKKCMSCHDNRQYTRPNRIIHTFEDLHARVEFCDTASNANFSFDDIDDVVEYLNVTFYKFKK
jgi:hypothetical protein